MGHILYSFHPIRGVCHEEIDASGLSDYMESVLKRDTCFEPYLPEYYVHSSNVGRGAHEWWYYCRPQPQPANATAVQMIRMNPWQKRSPDGVPKQIRAYHLLLG